MHWFEFFRKKDIDLKAKKKPITRIGVLEVTLLQPYPLKSIQFKMT